jgi:Asp-tRNA(Asn)/Glu-tRNA(Gln) amidotransferase C subunit
MRNTFVSTKKIKSVRKIKRVKRKREAESETQTKREKILKHFSSHA